MKFWVLHPPTPTLPIDFSTPHPKPHSHAHIPMPTFPYPHFYAHFPMPTSPCPLPHAHIPIQIFPCPNSYLHIGDALLFLSLFLTFPALSCATSHLPIPYSQDEVTCPVSSWDPLHGCLEGAVKLENITEKILQRKTKEVHVWVSARRRIK